MSQREATSNGSVSGRKAQRVLALAIVVLFVGPAVGTGVVAARAVEFEPNAARNPFEAADAGTVALLAGSHDEDALAALVHPVWASGDAEAVKRYLAEHYDPVTDDFSFTGPTAVADEGIARAILMELAVAEQFLGSMGEGGQYEDVLRHLLATGTLPEGWFVVDDNGVPVDMEGRPVLPGPWEPEAPAPAPAPEAAEPQPEPQPEPEAVVIAGEAPMTSDSIDTAPPADYMDGRGNDVGGVWTTSSGPGAASTTEESTRFHMTDSASGCGKCDQYLFAGSSPITGVFDLGNITPDEINDAVVDISAYDVDWGSTGCSAGPERDLVQLNGNTVGYLTGADNSWSSTSFSLDPSWFVEGSNRMDVIIDSTGTGCWAVQVDFFSLNVNHFVGPVEITAHDTDKDAYNVGESISVETTVKTDEEGPYGARLEWNLVRPDGEIVDTNAGSITLQQGVPATYTTTFPIPSGQPTGKWTVVAIVYDKDGAKSDERSKIVSVGTDLIIADDDLTVKILDVNANTGVAKIELTVKWQLKTEITDPQDYAVEIAVEQDGNRGPVERIDRSDAGGSFELTRTINAKPGGKVKVSLDFQDAIKETREDNNDAEKSLCNPKVKSADPKIDPWYFSGIKLENEWTAEVEPVADGCSEVVKVIYQFGGSSSSPTAEATGGGNWKATFDMGKMKEGWQEPVKVYAEDADGNRGEPWETTVTVLDLPAFIIWGLKAPGGAFSTSLEIHGDSVTYKFSVRKTLFDSNKRVTEPKIDKLGGGWGAKLTVFAGAEASTKNWALTISGGIGGDVKASDSVKTGLEGSISGKFENPGDGGGWRLVEVKITVKRLLLEVSFPIYKSVVVSVNMTIGVEPSGSVTFSDTGSPKLFGTSMGYESFTFAVGIKVGVTAKLGGDGVLALAGELTGKVTPKFGTPEPAFKEVGFNIKFRLYAEVWGWEKDIFGISWTTTYRNYLVEPEDGWRLPERSWTSDEAYATFVADTTRDVIPGLTAPAVIGGTVRPLSTGATGGDLVQNLYPQADPATAMGPDGRLVTVFVHDDALKARPGSFDPYFMVFDGTNWSPPAPIDASAHADFHPAVAVNADGQAIAAWVRFKDPSLTETDVLPEMAHLTEIAYATYSPDAGWSAVQVLTDNGVMDAMPQVAADGSGGFLVAWASADASAFLSDSQASVPDEGPVELPDRDLNVARVTPGLPGAVQPRMTVARDLPLLDVHRVAGTSDGSFLLLYAVDNDADQRTPDDVSLYAQAGAVGALLGAPVLLAEGALHAPALADAGAGVAVAAWRAEEADRREGAYASDLRVARVPGQGLVVVAGDAYTLVPPTTGHPTLNEFRITVDALAGDRIVTWSAPANGGDGQQTFTVVSPATGVPAGVTPAVIPLTDADSVAWRGTPVVTRDAAGSRTLAVIGLDATGGGTNLAAAARPLMADLEVTGVDATVENPAPGSALTVIANVRNRGDVDVATATVTLLDNGATVSEQVVPLTRGAGRPVAFAWTVPGDGRAHDLTVVMDAAGVVEESNEENNAAGVTTVLPDLAVYRFEDATTREGGFAVRATLANHGVREAPAGEARLVDEETGEVLGVVAFDALAPGAERVIDVTPHLATLPVAGALVAFEVAPMEDADRSNDRDVGFIASLPDLAIGQSDLVVGERVGETAPATLRVHNVGTRDAPGATVRVLNGHPGEGGEVLAEHAVGAIAAGGNATVTLDLDAPAGVRKHWVHVEAAGFREANVANNVAWTTTAYSGRADADVTEASLAFEPEGVRVTVFNRGDDHVPHASVKLYNGYPTLDGPKYGRRFVTIVETLVGRGAVEDVPPGGSASTLVPYSALDLAQIPTGGRLYAWLDPHNVTLDADRSNHVGFTPMLSVASPTHPDPATPAWASTAEFRFGAPLGRTMNGVSWVLDRNAGTVPDAVADTTATTLTVNGLADGTWWLHARGNLSGAWTETTHYRLQVDARDSTAPVTTLVASSPALHRNGALHVNPDVTLHLDAVDAAEGGVSGVAATEYRVDGAAWQAYTGGFTLAAPGTHALEWRSVDNAGNAEAVKSETVIVEKDVDPPVTLLAGVTTVFGDARVFVRAGDLLGLVATDPEPYLTTFASGVAATEYRVDGAAWQPFPASGFRLAEPGEHVVEWRSTDAVGNAEDAKSIVVLAEADVHAPVSVISGGRVIDGRTFATADTTFSLVAAETGEYVTTEPSGLTGIRYRVDGGFWRAYTKPFTVTGADGAHVVEWFAKDWAGNAEAVNRLTVTLDATGPAAGFTSHRGGEWVTGDVQFAGTADDGAGAGVRSVSVHRDGRFVGVAERSGDAWTVRADTSHWPIGNNAVTVRAVDVLGNVGETTVRVFVVSPNAEIIAGIGPALDRYRPDRLPQP